MTEEPTLFGAINNVATQVAPCRPWDFKSTIPQEVLASKATYTAWRAHPKTEHLIISNWEGLNSGIRVNAKTNPPRRLHAIIADYDTKITDAEFDSVLDRAPTDLRPTWISRTFSGGVRLVWMFEQPLPLEVSEISKPFMRAVAKALCLNKLFPAFDEPAFFSVTKLYDVGRDWKKLGDYKISNDMLHFWLTEATKFIKIETDELTIPLADVAAEVERRFPGRWSGSFEEGKRGPVFFDPESTNPTAAIVVDNGMICFSQAKLFYSWFDIFGPGFVRQYQKDKVGAAVAGTWFDGNRYYQKINDRWVHVAKEDFQKYLAANKSLRPDRLDKDTASEVTRAEMFVQHQRRVNGAIPFLFDPRDMIEREGQRFLNTSYVRAMQPAEIYSEWGVNFPWLAEFYDTFFDPQEQLDYWRLWFKRFYGSALAGKLLRGQNVFLVGGVDIGKTLMAHKIIGAALGGCADASDHVVRGTEFNKKLGEMALWTIDDGQVAQDSIAHRKFGEMVKKLAANPTMNFRKMYQDAETIEWSGRLFTTLNNDVHSLQLLPDLSISLEDKVLIFNAANVKRVFPPSSILEPMILAELPHFLRWHLEWTPPEHVVSNSRFGVARYVHDALRSAAMFSGATGELLEVIALWVKTEAPAGPTWQGTATEWYAKVSINEVLRPLISKTGPRVIGRRFTEASRIRDSGITLLREDKKRGNVYSIAIDAPAEARKTNRFTPGVD